MEISDQEILEEFKCPFTIINRIDKQNFQNSISKRKTLKPNWFSSLTLEVGINKACASSGGELDFNIKFIRNQIASDFRIKTQLIKEISYGLGEKTSEILLEKTNRYGRLFISSSGPMKIPGTSGDLNGSMIKIRHFLRMTYCAEIGIKNYSFLKQKKLIADLPVVIVND